MFVLVLLLLLLGSRLCLSRFQRFFHVLGGFVGLAVVVHGYLRFVFFGYGNHLFFTGFLLLVRIPLVKAWAVLFLVHADIGIEFVASPVNHVFQVERATAVECLTLFF